MSHRGHRGHREKSCVRVARRGQVVGDGLAVGYKRMEGSLFNETDIKPTGSDRKATGGLTGEGRRALRSCLYGAALHARCASPWVGNPCHGLLLFTCQRTGTRGGAVPFTAFVERGRGYIRDEVGGMSMEKSGDVRPKGRICRVVGNWGGAGGYFWRKTMRPLVRS